MAIESHHRGGRRARRWRVARWGGATVLLLSPLVAMQFRTGVDWDETDFIVLGAMLAAACSAYELAARMARNAAYRAAVGVAAVAALLLIWINLAVGIIGSENNPANLMYAGVLAIALAGTVVARGEPAGMARALMLTALAQALAGVVALATEAGVTGENWPRDVIVLTGFFSTMWLGSAWLFRKSA